MPEPPGGYTYPQVMGVSRVCNEEVEASGRCYVCWWPTHDLDLSFECWLCFPVCYVVLWEQYFDDCMKINALGKQE